MLGSNSIYQEASVADPWGAPESGSDDDVLVSEYIVRCSGKEYRIAQENLAAPKIGGTARFYEIKQGELAGFGLKIYRESKLSRHREELESKASRMISIPPKNVKIETGKSIRPQFAWPIGVVYNIDQLFCGLLLPYIDVDTQAYRLDVYLQEIQSLDSRHQSITERVQVARNLAAAVIQLHAAGHFFIDMKAQNIFVFKKESTVSFIDCDGFSINKGEFPAHEYTRGYIAPEFLDRRPEELSESPDQDYYVLSFLIFQILDFNNTPFSCGISDPSLHSVDDDWQIDVLARKGLYAYGLNNRPGLVPRKSSIYKYWPIRIRSYFDRAFDPLSSSPRPSALEWSTLLHDIVSKWDFEKCKLYPENEAHRHFTGTNCFACEVFDKMGVEKAAKRREDDLKSSDSRSVTDAANVSYSEPLPPRHWTDLLTGRFSRLKRLRGVSGNVGIKHASRNFVAAMLQFVWLLSHGILGVGLLIGSIIVAVFLYGVWNPHLLWMLLPIIGSSGVYCFLYSDYLLFKRLEGWVSSEGGFQKISEKGLHDELKINIPGLLLALVLLFSAVVGVAYRVTQINYMREQVVLAIESTSSLRQSIDEYVRRTNFASPISSYSPASESYHSVFNGDAIVSVEAGRVVVEIKSIKEFPNARIVLEPRVLNGNVDWSSCKSEDQSIPTYMLPSNCRE